jgi:hypothetical protein
MKASIATAWLALGALAIAAAPAAAQGTFNSGRKSCNFGTACTAPPAAPKPGYGQAPAVGAQPRAYGAPAASSGGFKPYEPFKGSSVYGAPKTNPSPDPCTTSVYVNACQKSKR